MPHIAMKPAENLAVSLARILAVIFGTLARFLLTLALFMNDVFFCSICWSRYITERYIVLLYYFDGRFYLEEFKGN